MNLCPGKSVGAIIKNEKSEYLCLYRLKHPTGLAFIAGHIDSTDKTPKDALIREVMEESGLKVVRCELVLNKVFPNPCARPPGYDGHEWFVYNVSKYEGKPKLMEPTKHRFVEFLSASVIAYYISKGEVDPAWFTYIIPELSLDITLK